MAQGVVKNMNKERGFGFIKQDDLNGSNRGRNSGDVFFHRSMTKIPFDEMAEGDRVEFEVEESPKGLRAVNVREQES